MRITGLMPVLAITVALMVGIACDGPDQPERPQSDVSSAAPAFSPTPAGAAVATPSSTTTLAGTSVPALSPTPTPTGEAVSAPSSTTTIAGTSALALSPTTTSAATAVPEPSPTTSSIDGATWILVSIYGQPPIAGTYATLTVNGPRFNGFDGCNFIGGRHQSGKPIIDVDGEISAPPFGGTAMGCMSPPGILDQADRYLDAMLQPARARLVDDRLHIVDRSGEVALAFVRQPPLAGRPVDLVGTSWRLVDDDGTYSEGDTTLLFLNSRAATGTTGCRDYTLGYTASDGRIRIPSKGMSGSIEACSRDAVKREHRFVEDFGWANEYSVHQVEGSKRLMVRTSKGKTLTFEPLPQPAGAIFDARWHLTRFLETRSNSSGMTRPRDTEVIPGVDVTAAFSKESVAGSLECQSYAYRAVGGQGTILIGADGTIFNDDAAVSTKNSCGDQRTVSPQQRQYIDFLAAAERYHVFGDRLVILTSSGDGLVFRSATGN